MEEKTVSTDTCRVPTFNMNSLLNSTTIHIIIEVIAICGLSAFFNSKLNKQAKIIKELTDKIIEQEETINRHDELLEKIVNKLNGGPNKQNPISKPVHQSGSREQAEEIVLNQPQPKFQPASVMGGIPLNLISDIMNVAVGSNLQPQTHARNDTPLPSIEELDNELEAELNDLKTEDN